MTRPSQCSECAREEFDEEAEHKSVCSFYPDGCPLDILLWRVRCEHRKPEEEG